MSLSLEAADEAWVDATSFILHERASCPASPPLRELTVLFKVVEMVKRDTFLCPFWGDLLLGTYLEGIELLRRDSFRVRQFGSKRLHHEKDHS